MVADACQTMLRDSKALREFAEQKPEAAKGIIQWLADWFKKIKAAFSRSAQLSEQARFMEKLEKDVRAAFGQLWDDALREAVRVHDEIGNMESPTTEGGEQYSIREQDGFWYVQADRNVLTGNDPVQWGKQIENYINEKIRKGEDVIFPTQDGHLLILTGRSAYKLSDRHVSSIAKAAEAFLTDQQYAVKGNAAVHIDELIQVARFREYKEDVDGKHKNDVGEDGFNYFDAYFMNADGQYYLIPLSAGINENDETAYSVGNPKRRRFPNRAGSSSKTEALKNGGKPSVDNDSTNQPNRQEVKTAIQIAYEKALQEKAQNSDRDYLSAVESGDMEAAQRMVDEAAKAGGWTIHAYHGTGRADRVGTVFRPERATSGPMAYFTDSKEIADHYAKDKKDTSLAYDPDYDSYETQFRVKTQKGAKFPFNYKIASAWGYIDITKRNEIREKAGQLRYDWDGDDDNAFILAPGNKEANGGFQWQLKEAKRNVIKALMEQWLNSGNLFNEEARFLEVLKMVGITDELKRVGLDVEYKDPLYREEKTYDVFLKIKRPFVTSKVNNRFIENFLKWADKQPYEKYERESQSADLWDKTT